MKDVKGHTVVASKTTRINKEKAESCDFIALYSSSLSRGEVLPHRKRVNERIKKEKSHCRPPSAWLIQNPGNSNKEPLSWLTLAPTDAHIQHCVHQSTARPTRRNDQRLRRWRSRAAGSVALGKETALRTRQRRQIAPKSISHVRLG